MSDDTNPEIVAGALARRRFFTIQAVRIGGLAMVLIGILAMNRAIGLPAVAGYVLAAIGIVSFGVMPLLLSRRWRSPRP